MELKGENRDGTVCWFRTSYLQSHNLALYQVS